MNKLALVIPGLLGPLPELKETDHVSPVCSFLQKWLACAETSETDATNYYSLLAELFGVNQDYSITQFSVLKDACKTSTGHMLRADPVHFKADIDHAILLDYNRLDIQPAEAHALATAFNAHFCDDGVELVVGHNHRWYLSFDQPVDIQTTALQDAVGRNVNHFLPTGCYALNWKRLLNEAQMLFHSHEVNVARESKGQMTINSLWLWGEGNQAESVQQRDWDWVMSDDVIANGMAIWAGVKSLSLELPGETLSLPQGKGIIVLDQLIGPVSYGDIYEWKDVLEEMCSQWLSVLHHLLKTKKIQNLELYSADGRQFKLTAASFFKFWRRKKSIASYVSM